AARARLLRSREQRSVGCQRSTGDLRSFGPNTAGAGEARLIPSAAARPHHHDKRGRRSRKVAYRDSRPQRRHHTATPQTPANGQEIQRRHPPSQQAARKRATTSAGEPQERQDRSPQTEKDPRESAFIRVKKIKKVNKEGPPQGSPSHDARWKRPRQSAEASAAAARAASRAALKALPST